MSKGKRIVFMALGVYLVALVGAWVWFLPSLVDKRVHEHISIGAKADVVKNTFHIGNPFDIESAAHCGSNGPQNVTRIAVYDAGGVPLLPLPMSLTTTTTFCFDKSDTLVGIKTSRWLDGP